MWCAERDPPAFDGGSLVPVATYLLTVGVLAGLALAVSGASPPPVLGMAWGIFLAALAVGALTAEGVSSRSILPPARSLLPAVAVLVAFWGLYNLVGYALALGGVAGFEPTPSRVVAHPLLYLAALGSSLLFTALPEELMFRGYLQQKCTALAGDGRRAVAVGVVAAAVLFACVHLPRWFLMSGHGVSAALGGRLLGLALAGLAYGLAYALTRNLWLVAVAHATMNQPPFLLSVTVPAELHLPVAVVEYAALLALVAVTARVTDGEFVAGRPHRGAGSTTDD